MGMYSRFIEQDIKIVGDTTKMMEQFKEAEIMAPIHDCSINFGINFSVWDEQKLEGYWFDETKKALNILAEHITGSATFMYENEYFFRIFFNDGKAYIQKQPIIDWSVALPVEVNLK